ncbi:MAG: hypothetical protein MUC94_16405 [bacterium]|nr:hypothetical protein [bacterium]
MSIALTLQIPDHIYIPILNSASLIGKTPEQIISEWLEKMVSRINDDPLLQLAGVFESNIANVSDAHDEYIGQSLRGDNE